VPEGETSDEAQGLAEASARCLRDEDRAARAAGIELLRIAPGRATMAMEVAAHMTNGHGMCHGGYIFLLADTAFAYACNSHGQRTVAAGAEIHFIAPARLGERLVAEATERHRGVRSGIYDVCVTGTDGRRIALFRGRSASIRGSLVPAASDPQGANRETGG
jgi:acyl-CoA thioesterase